VTAAVGLVLVGDELVEGRAADTNGAWLARRIGEAGARVARWLVVEDDEAEIARALGDAAGAAALVLVSGGLGPTDDDRTREGIARAANAPLEEDPVAWAWIQAVLARRGRPCLPVQRRQALVPRGARALENRAGIAPGIEARVDGALVLAFPGVPSELVSMFEQHGAPALAALPDRVPTALARIATAGLPETEVAARLGDLALSDEPAFGWYPHHGEVEVTVRARGPDAARRAEAAAAEARRRIGEGVLDVAPGERIEHAVIARLKSRGLKLATAESLTGGLVAHLLTQVPGASLVYPAGWVTYSDAAKQRELGVGADTLRTHGAVSAQVAGEMAQGARANAGVEVGVATTGIAGPGAETAPSGAALPCGAPAGTAFVAVSVAGKPTQTRQVFHPLERALVQRRVAVDALVLLLRSLS
jgi:nicotinamide-nucleotide amidase